MKKVTFLIISIFAFAAISTISIRSLAQDSSPAPATQAPQGAADQAWTPEERRELVEAAKALRALVGGQVVPAPAPEVNQNAGEQRAQQTQTSKEDPEVTIARVADKMLNLLSGSLSYVAAKVEKAAPHVWRVMIRQQYAKAIGDLVVPLSLFFGALIATFVFNYKFGRPIKDCCGGGKSSTYCDTCAVKLWCGIILPAVALVIFGSWTADRLADSAKYLINPEYYAIRDLVLLITNRGQGI